MESILFSLLQEYGAQAGWDDLCIDWGMEGMEVDGKRFQHIGGLQHFPELAYLSIAGHELQSLEGLPMLQQLERLNLSNNDLQGIDHLPPFPKLAFLDLSLNAIRDIERMPLLPSLRELHLSHNPLGHVRGIERCPALLELYLTGNSVLSNLEELGSLQHLQTLFVKDCPVADWHFLPALSSLRHLAISPLYGERLGPLADLNQLESLSIWAVRMFDDLVLPPLPALKRLSLREGPRVGSVSGMDGLLALEHLELRNANGGALPQGIESLERLSHLTVQEMEKIEWGLLAELPNLAGITLKPGVNPAGLEDLVRDRPDIQIAN